MDTKTFIDTMASLAASVTIVTVESDDGPSGLTVSAFTSVSADPPVILVCIDERASTLPVLLSEGGFTVNLMPQGTSELAMLFATPDTDRFGATGWRPVAGAGPVLEDAFGYFVCRTVGRTEMGDHWVLYGEVIDGGLVDSDAEPLVYRGRRFARLEDL